MVDTPLTQSDTIDLTQIEVNFQERTQMRAQQRMALTEPFITWVGGKGRETKTTFWGTNTLDQKSERHERYPTKETPREAYWFGTMHFWEKEPIDGDDQLFDAVDAGTGLGEVWAAAAARELDRTMINAAIGTAYKGRYGQNTAQVLPSAMIIPHGSVGLTAAKVIQGVSMLRRAHPDGMDPIVTFVTSWQINRDLLGEEKLINRDYTDRRPLENLDLPFALGTYFKTVEDLANYHPNDPTKTVQWDPILPILIDGVSSGIHIRYVVMWVKSAMRGKKDRPIQTRIHDESKDHGPDAKSITVDMMVGASRVNPLGVVVIECAEASVISF